MNSEIIRKKISGLKYFASFVTAVIITTVTKYEIL